MQNRNILQSPFCLLVCCKLQYMCVCELTNPILLFSLNTLFSFPATKHNDRRVGEQYLVMLRLASLYPPSIPLLGVWHARFPTYIVCIIHLYIERERGKKEREREKTTNQRNISLYISSLIITCLLSPLLLLPISYHPLLCCPTCCLTLSTFFFFFFLRIVLCVFIWSKQLRAGWMGELFFL